MKRRINSIAKSMQVHVGVAWVFFLLGIIFCISIYQAGQYENLQVGGNYLLGMPNYYSFYVLILPFIAAGVVYTAHKNRHLRLFGEIGSDLDDDLAKTIKKRRIWMLALCIFFSISIVIGDAQEKNFTLPPFAFSFQNLEDEKAATRSYACLKKWIEECVSVEQADSPQGYSKRYLDTLQERNVQLTSASGFATFSEWLEYSSWLYRFESFLSFLAALIICLFIAQTILLIVVKNFSKLSTQNLTVWLVMLITLWFPCKIYSAWYFSLDTDQSALGEIFITGVVVAVLGLGAILYIKSSRKEIEKYLELGIGIISLGLGAIGYFKPDLFLKATNFLREFSIFYIIPLAGMAVLILFHITEDIIREHEKESDSEI